MMRRWRKSRACEVRLCRIVRVRSIDRLEWMLHWVSTGRVVRVGAVVRVRWWRVHGARRSPGTHVRRCEVVRRTPVHGRLVCSMTVTRRAHRTANDGRDGALPVESRFRAHALLCPNMTELRVVRGLHQALFCLRG